MSRLGNAKEACEWRELLVLGRGVGNMLILRVERVYVEVCVLVIRVAETLCAQSSDPVKNTSLAFNVDVSKASNKRVEIG